MLRLKRNFLKSALYRFNQSILSRVKVSENITQIKVNLKQNINKIDTTDVEAILMFSNTDALVGKPSCYFSL